MLVPSLIGSAWGFAVALVLGPVAGQHGLVPGGPLANWLVFAGNTLGGVAFLVANVLVVWGIRGTLARTS